MKCRYCNREPKVIYYYQCVSELFNLTLEEAVKNFESSYEPDTDRFTCIGCFQTVEKPLEDWLERQQNKN
ncbi:hypothetical protein RAK27_18965 [Carnobacterium maltaromaticum]|uniref:Uncharacterized protein n=1 Tax=Carnobacterium maltaromaticum TaxID=2751 RepID=A0AAW9JYL1_CARML|nr:hypothetical protein [Carnobacterium maltaromaticum]MDZ5760728.1 hypothetical protein [Carnobacterium maltaromaticum]